MRVLLLSTFCASTAGFLGGYMAQLVQAPLVVHAQTARIEPFSPQTSPGDPSAPRELTSDRFVLTDSKGRVRGEFKITKGEPEIDLYDTDGKLMWKAPGGPHLVY